MEEKSTDLVAARPAEVGEDGIQETEGIDPTGVLEEVVVVIFNRASLKSVGLLNKESIADMTIGAPIHMIYRRASNSKLDEWRIRRSSKG